MNLERIRDEAFRIVAIDPGTNTLGFSVIEVDLDNLEIYIIDAKTFTAAKVVRRLRDTSSVYSKRRQFLNWHEDNLVHELSEYKPHAVIVEAPFIGKFATAFEALLECREMIKEAVLEYDTAIETRFIDPMSVKEVVGATELTKKRRKELSKKLKRSKLRKAVKEGLKDDMQQALCQLKDVNWLIDSDTLDEHAIDATAVGVYLAYQIRDELIAERKNIENFGR